MLSSSTDANDDVDCPSNCEIVFPHPPKGGKSRATILDTVLALQDYPNRPSTIHIRGDPSVKPLREDFPIGTGLQIDACIKRAEKFESSGDELLFSLETSNEYAAYRSYEAGFSYVSVLKQDEPLLLGVTEKNAVRLAEKHTWMRLACLIYAMNNGFLGDKTIHLEIAMRKYLQHPIAVAVKASLYLGMVLMQHSRELQAIYYLRMALFLEPGLPKAEQKADELYHRIQLDTRMKDRLAGAFELIMTPVRHHRPHARMSRSEQHLRFELDREERNLVAAITRVRDAGLPDVPDDEQNNTGGRILPMTSFPEISSLVALVRKRSRDAEKGLVWDEVWQELVSVALSSVVL
ncbi:MAG: hypothetical protein Q9193_001057 [Seirophora villosa]